MKPGKFNILLLFFLFCLESHAQTPFTVSDVTIHYSLSTKKFAAGKAFEDTKKIVYIKGKMVRVDLISSSYRQTFINSGQNIILLKEIENQKYLINLSPEDWKKQNIKYDGSEISFTGMTEKILNYNCKNAIMRLTDGTEYNIYYTNEINTIVSENNYEFGKIAGLVLKYEISGLNHKAITYTATAINFDIIPNSKFDISPAGYRILTDPDFF